MNSLLFKTVFLFVSVIVLVAIAASILEVLAAFMPALLICWLYARQVAGWHYSRLSRGAAIPGALAIVVSAVCVTLSILVVESAVLDISSGLDPLLSALKLCLGVVAAGAVAYIYHSVVKGRIMKNIFSVLDNTEQFDAFADESEAPLVIEIEPDKLKEQLKAEVIGQDSIIDECVTSLVRRVRIARKAKPLGVFMFVGASGAGKTELAKAMAKYAFEGRILRYDMNQFTESHSTQSLIGAPSGYMGSDKGGQLTQDIKRMRSGVILLDEIEKAHPDVFKLIMGLLDEGRITEQSTGQTMDATKFVIVMTSNAEHEKLADIAVKISDLDDRRRAIKDTLQTVFKPEQLARIDDVFCFKKLDKRSQAQVIGKFLFSFAADVGVELVKVDTDLLIELIKRHEKQADYGIRELVRLIEKMVLDGMYDAKDAGYTQVAIVVDGNDVRIAGVAAAAGRGRDDCTA